MVDEQLLKLLVCPETKQPLRLASTEELQSLNAQVAAGAVVNRAGGKVVTPLDALLIREDGACGYPVWEDIPVMLIEEAVPLGRNA
jgi:uncharacterized protein YbaR (Trm112 family)